MEKYFWGLVAGGYLHIVENKFRRLKTPQSRRNLALHSELIRLGFLDYVQAITQAGPERLFPDLYSPSSKKPVAGPPL